MKQYNAKKILNIALAGHGGCGKTSVAESMIYLAKASERLGNIADGNTVLDYDSEEIKRQTSILTSVAPIEWKNTKINIIDTPGLFDFEGGVAEGMRAADSALIVVSGKDGVNVGTAPNFRQALARKAGRFMGRTLDPETDMVVTIGSTEAMVDTIFALTNPGDKIIMFSPYFENYRAQAIMADCEPVFVPLVPPEFNFDANVLEDAFKQGAKAILICNPSNPSGKVFTYDELKLISELCIKYDAFAIMDEVYKHIVYDGHKHIYMNSLPGMWERTVSCSSLSKTYSITGWRLGYAIAPQPIMDRIKQYHDFNTVGAPSPLMEAAVVGLDMPDSYYQEFGAHYAHMKKLFTDGLKQIGIPFTDPQGAYFVLADIGPYMRKGESDVDFCLEMAEKVGVACVPGTSFFNENINHIVRVHFAKKDETLYEALERLSHLKEKMG